MCIQNLSKCLLAVLLCCTGIVRSNAATLDSGGLSRAAIAQRLETARVPFVTNQGQLARDEVSFYARMFAGTLFVTDRSELVYALPQRRTDRQNPHQGRLGMIGVDGGAPVLSFRERFSHGGEIRPLGGEPSAVRVSQYLGDRHQSWRSSLSAWDSLNLGEPYPGIRVSVKAAGNNVEKLFHVAPGAEPGAIEIAVDGVNGLRVDQDGRLALSTALGDILFTAPAAYQIVDGARRPVDVAYVAGESNRYGFRVGGYDRDRELVIDPLLASTYVGGRNPSPPGNYDDDIVYDMVVSGGDVYIAGVTQSPDFPIVLGYDHDLPNAYPDGFVALLSGDLSAVIASTYFGTDSFDRVSSIALDADGSLVVVGQAGYGFPVTDGAYTWSGETPTGGGFVARFSPDLSTLIASAIPTPSDYPAQVELGNGGIYFGGTTNNIDFRITPGAYKATCCPTGGFGIRDYDGFAGKLSPDLGTLEAMTYLGGDLVSGISVAPDGKVFITDGSDNAVTGYIARFDAGLTTREAYLSYYPGSQSGSSRTYFNEVVAGDGFVVTAGQTYMDDLPATPGAYDTTCGTDGVCDGIGPLLVPLPDGFVAKYSSNLQDTLALTYLGGLDGESIRALVLGPDGDIYVAGETISVDFPTTGDDTTCGSDGQCDPIGSDDTPVADGFVARLSADLSHLVYGTYLGGSGEDFPLALALDDAGLLYVAGYTRSSDFPTTPGAFDDSYNGGTSDAFVSLIDTGSGGSGENQPPVADAGPDQTAGPRELVSFDGTGSYDADGHIASYLWGQVSGPRVMLQNADTATASFRAPAVRRGGVRVLVFELMVTDDHGAAAGDDVRIEVGR